MFASRTATDRSAPPPAIPPGVRAYAVGDIHGRADLLVKMHEAIRADAEACGSDVRRLVIYLGDYIDRGLQSRRVVDELLRAPLRDFLAVHLKGNHDEFLLAFLRGDLEMGRLWLANGGETTLASYGVNTDGLFGYRTEGALAAARRELGERLPPRHRAFFEGLKLSCSLGDYFFAHAGVRPGVPLDRQDPEDLIWIREPFLRSSQAFGKVVVHGHTPAHQPEVRPNRIGIDTGACFGGRLTCLVLEGTNRRFLQV